jgi:hypothetical protein
MRRIGDNPENSRKLREKIKLWVERKNPGGSPAGKAGGIDFRALPIATQPMPRNLGTVPLPLQGIAMSGTTPSVDGEWQQIRNMLDGGLIPSIDRLKAYVQGSCDDAECKKRVDNAISGLADIFRIEEERCVRSDGPLKQLLALLESGKPAPELKKALAAIVIAAGE